MCNLNKWRERLTIFNIREYYALPEYLQQYLEQVTIK